MTDNTEREALLSVIREVYDPWDQTPERVADAILDSDVWRNRQTETVSDENAFTAMDQAFREHDAPAWGVDDMARDVAIRWHQRGFLDGMKFATRPVITDDMVEIAGRAAYVEACALLDREPNWVEEAGEDRECYILVARAALEAVFGETHQPEAEESE